MTTFNLNLATNTQMTISAKDMRQALVENAFTMAATNVKSGLWTRENAVKALQPILDTLTSGVKAKGHADAIKELVQVNLDAAMAAIPSEEPAKAKGK